MRTLFIAAAAAAIGLCAGLSIGSPQAADEVRCRVNAEALLQDIAKLQDVQADFLRKVLNPKPAN